MKIKRRDLLAVLILLLLWGFFSWRYLTPNKADRVAFPEGDFGHHYYVYRAFAYRELAAGRFPLWLPISAATLLIGAVAAVAARRRPQQEGAPTAHGP